MPGPDPRNTREIKGQVNKKLRGSLGKSKPPKELVPKPSPTKPKPIKKMKKGGKA